ncbi:hypothetical protein COHA_003533 [Chlorella ohadii]|uniref:Uncharacterized protein n=1 Tax=Chlorella ohadii TaxID=2649997 RepID=A0AAD5DSA0_9CHLO|nr:hypothetical protein COHA_003533 [Chlorella ohadii]
MIQEVARDLFLDAAVTHVMEGQEEGGQGQPAASGGAAAAVAAAVGRRLEQMDGTFLATLDSYIQGASDRGAAEVAELLLMVRDEVLRRLSERLPPEGGAAAGSREADALRLPFRQAGAVPKADTAFVQRLMGLSAPDERRALLEWAFEDDRERLHDTQGIGAQRGTPLTTFERARKAAEAPQEWVRPGRFMQCVAVLQQEMLERAEGAQAGSPGSGSSGGEGVPSDAVLERLESVRREALEVLLALAEEGLPYRP